MSAAVTKREEAVSQREQSIKDAPAELRKQGELLDARKGKLDILERELRQKKESLNALEVTLDNKHNEITLLQKRGAELVQISAAVTKREQAVSRREQSIKDEAAELRKQGARVDARERALDIREHELGQKRKNLDALEATRDKKWIQVKAEVARFERRKNGLHNEIARLQTRMAKLRKAKEPPRKLTGPPKDMPPVEHLDFELLPPGSWDVADVLKHYRKMARRMPAGFRGERPDWQRIREIQKLKPVKCYVGKKMWEGYAVYTFRRTPNVVLECPFEGNATYILDENWKPKVSHTKQYVREHYNYGKIVHKGEWLDRVRDSLSRPLGITGDNREEDNERYSGAIF